MRAAVLLLAVSMCLASPSATAAEELGYKLVVHPSNPAASLARQEVSNLFLKKLRTWPAGQRAQPVDLAKDHKVREPFSQGIHGKPVGAIKSYWRQQVFAGKEFPPVEYATEEEVLAFVRREPNAIGYVGATTATAGVRVVEVK